MRVVLQRVSRAEVRVGGRSVGAIGAGYVALIGVAVGDHAGDIDYIARKMAGLRLWPDAAGKMNLPLRQDAARGVLAISQFTLMADCAHGLRPSFDLAAPAVTAQPLFESLVVELRAQGIEVSCGVFGAHMEVELVNDGPVTIILNSRERGNKATAGASGVASKSLL